jgi:hypothetical protein
MRVCELPAVLLITVMIASMGYSSGCNTGSDSEIVFYPGGELPGSVPEVFAPGIISDAGYRLHGAVVFDPRGGLIMWPVVPPAVMSIYLVDGEWSEAAKVPLPGRAVQAPAFTADGSRLFYQCAMEGGRGSLDIWYVDRTEDGWGPPVNAGAGVNSEALESQPTLTGDGTLYFTGTLEGSGLNRGIYRSRLVDGEYAAPELLGGNINGEYIDYCPWIAADESYLLFASSRPETEEPLYLHISFRLPGGSWSEPENIHPAIGFEGSARFPSVSPDGRFLFFLSGKNVYWVDIENVLEMKDS